MQPVKRQLNILKTLKQQKKKMYKLTSKLNFFSQNKFLNLNFESYKLNNIFFCRIYSQKV